MSAKDLLDQIQIKSPCPADWNSMIGNDQVRFCEHCNLPVNNLSQMTRKRALRLVTYSKGRLCVRYEHQTAVPPPLHQIANRVSKLAAGAFTAALTVSSALAQPIQRQSSGASDKNISAIHHGMFLNLQGTASASIGGTIFDSNGAVIPGATITLTNEQGGYYRTTTSDSEGKFKFEMLDSGTFNLTIEASGFTTTQLTQIDLAANDSQRFDQVLQVGLVTATVGVVALPEPTEPLVLAAQQDDFQAVQMMLTTSNVNLRDQGTGTSALECAVRNGNREMVQVLLSAGADVKDRNSAGQTVLMMLGEEGTSDIAWDLINEGAKVDVKDSDGDTPLMEAARCHNVAVLNALLQAGAKVDVRNQEGQTALMMAASSGLTANVKALIAAGADKNAQDNDHKTALDYAIENDQQKVIKLLQSYGALEGEMAHGN